MKEKLIELAVMTGFGFMIGFVAHSFADNIILRDIRNQRDELREEVRRWRSGWVPRKAPAEPNEGGKP
jgi:hypothetical protein